VSLISDLLTEKIVPQGKHGKVHLM